MALLKIMHGLVVREVWGCALIRVSRTSRGWDRTGVKETRRWCSTYTIHWGNPKTLTPMKPNNQEMS